MSPRHAVRARLDSARHINHRSRRHPIVRTAALVVVAVISFAATGAATAYVRLGNNIETHDVTELLGQDRPVRTEPVDPTDPNAGRALNILVMGSDVRDGENGEIGGTVEGMRSDTTIVMHIAADRTHMEMVSIPRDSHVDIPACLYNDGSSSRAQDDRFNAAFSIGAVNDDVGEAAACTITTVESLTGVFIDGWVVVDFVGFRNMVDALGGVPICIPEAMQSDKAALNLQAGIQVLDGTTALAFARARTGTGLGNGSDINRVGRQQQLLAAIAREVFSKSLLTDLPSLYRFAGAATRSLTADPVTGDPGNLAGLAYSLRDMSTGSITFMTVPFRTYPPDHNQVEWTADAAQIWANMAADVPIIAAPTPAAPGETPAPPAPAETIQPGIDPFTPDDITAVCG